MKQSLENAKPFGEAIARLLHPFAEVVIHDLEKDQIKAIFNPLSRREVGDCSYLEKLAFDTSEDVIGPYEKTNWDGRPMKAISVVLKDKQGKAEGFLCVNLDTSHFESAKQVLESFLGSAKSVDKKTERLFKDDLYEKINLYVQSYCRENQVSLNALSKGEKQEIVHALESNGAFKGRNAASYIGRVLGISRATVYNYMKENAT